MVFNIQDFRSNGLVYGGARPNQFQLVLTPPTALGLDLVSARKFEYAARAASLPESRVGKIEVSYFGRKIKLGGDREFDDWNVSIMNDEDFGVRSMFEKWSNSVNRMVSNTRDTTAALEGYKADMQAIQYSKDGEIIRAYTIVGAWPYLVGAIDLDWDTTNTIEQFPVTFAYDWWEPLTETSSKILGGINQFLASI